MLLLLAGALASAASARQASDSAAAVVNSPVTRLAPGTFLVAARSLTDPNFARSVVLLIDYGDAGAFGLIVNRPLTVKLADAVPELAPALEGRDDRLNFGGPVGRRALLILLQSDKPPPAGRVVFDRVYLSPEVEHAREVLSGERNTVAVRAYSGYAGWAPQQLDAEVERGDWLVVSAETRHVFSEDPSLVWPELIARHGGTWAQLRSVLAQR